MAVPVPPALDDAPPAAVIAADVAEDAVVPIIAPEPLEDTAIPIAPPDSVDDAVAGPPVTPLVVETVAPFEAEFEARAPNPPPAPVAAAFGCAGDGSEHAASTKQLASASEPRGLRSIGSRMTAICSPKRWIRLMFGLSCAWRHQNGPDRTCISVGRSSLSQPLRRSFVRA